MNADKAIQLVIERAIAEERISEIREGVRESLKSLFLEGTADHHCLYTDMEEWYDDIGKLEVTGVPRASKRIYNNIMAVASTCDFLDLELGIAKGIKRLAEVAEDTVMDWLPEYKNEVVLMLCEDLGFVQ